MNHTKLCDLISKEQFKKKTEILLMRNRTNKMTMLCKGRNDSRHNKREIMNKRNAYEKEEVFLTYKNDNRMNCIFKKTIKCVVLKRPITKKWNYITKVIRKDKNGIAKSNKNITKIDTLIAQSYKLQSYYKREHNIQTSVCNLKGCTSDYNQRKLGTNEYKRINKQSYLSVSSSSMKYRKNKMSFSKSMRNIEDKDLKNLLIKYQKIPLKEKQIPKVSLSRPRNQSTPIKANTIKSTSILHYNIKSSVIKDSFDNNDILSNNHNLIYLRKLSQYPLKTRNKNKKLLVDNDKSHFETYDNKVFKEYALRKNVLYLTQTRNQSLSTELHNKTLSPCQSLHKFLFIDKDYIDTQITPINKVYSSIIKSNNDNDILKDISTTDKIIEDKDEDLETIKVHKVEDNIIKQRQVISYRKNNNFLSKRAEQNVLSIQIISNAQKSPHSLSLKNENSYKNKHNDPNDNYQSITKSFNTNYVNSNESNKLKDCNSQNNNNLLDNNTIKTKKGAESNKNVISIDKSIVSFESFDEQQEPIIINEEKPCKISLMHEKQCKITQSDNNTYSTLPSKCSQHELLLSELFININNQLESINSLDFTAEPDQALNLLIHHNNQISLYIKKIITSNNMLHEDNQKRLNLIQKNGSLADILLCELLEMTAIQEINDNINLLTELINQNNVLIKEVLRN